MMLIAHAGHWIVNVVLIVPTAGFLIWLLVITIRARRERDAEEGGSSRAPENRD